MTAADNAAGDEPQLVASAAQRVGLTDEEVAQRVAAGLTNHLVELPRVSLGQMVRTNALTPVNAIMATLFVLILVSGNPRDGLFVGVVLSNTFIGVIQELTARRELERLSILVAPTATVVRSDGPMVVDTEHIVLDDIVELSPGDQVPADGTVVEASGLRLDESMLTGESLPVLAAPGSEVLSGSFVVAGTGRFVTTAVGGDGYAGRLTTQAKSFTVAPSELRRSIDVILRWLMFIIPVVATVLWVSSRANLDRWQDALQGVVAAAVAMVPDGLVLMTSLALVAGVITLSRRQALAKQLSTVEVLARVDILCLDKTGTITSGHIELDHLHPLGDHAMAAVSDALGAMVTADDAPNATLGAISVKVGAATPWTVAGFEPFSSDRKWSAVAVTGDGSPGDGDSSRWFFVGAPDVLHIDHGPDAELLATLSGAGKRVVALATSANGPDGDRLPNDLVAMALLEFVDEIRPEAPAVLEYFARQGVQLKVISGDSPGTVAAISRRAGLHDDGDAVDARTLSEDPIELAAQMEAGHVFGRVSPHQKQQMVAALQRNGHVVAMTGDGVNDVLALKDSDLGIAMGSGSPAARAVADLVLTDDSFESMPVVVAEGRKVINNVERVANLFVSKAVYAVFVSLATAIAGVPFLFLPRQLTLIGTFSIGIPGFALALAPEADRVVPGMLRRVLGFSIPVGLIAGASAFGVFEVVRRTDGVELDQARTAATVSMLVLGLAILAGASRPLRWWKVLLVLAMAACFAAVLAVPWLSEFFELVPVEIPTVRPAVGALAAGLVGVGLVSARRRTRGSDRLV